MTAVLTAETWGGEDAPDRFVRALAHGEAQALDRSSPFGRCLAPLLHALGWRGDTRHLIEILPHCAEDIDLQDLRNVLATVDFRSRPLRTSMTELDPRLLPCLFVTSSGTPLVLLGRDGDRFSVYDGTSRRHIEDFVVCPERGQAYIFERMPDRLQRRTRQSDSWFRSLLGRFRGQLFLLAGIGFVATLPALATPLFIMMLYDTVIAAQSVALLLQLALAMAVLLLIDLLFRLLRARVMAYIATRIGRLVALGTLGRLMELSPAALNRAPLHAQLRRVRQFEGWRDYFSDPLVSVAFNLPFSIIFLIAITILGGNLVLLPIVVMASYALTAWFTGPRLERHDAEASEARQVRDACFDEMITDMRSVRLLGGESVWQERFRNYAAGLALAGARRARLQDLLQNAGQAAVTIAGIGTLMAGAISIMNGSMTIGALIACMAMVWRVLTPWQQCIALLPRIAQLRTEISMLDQTMQLPAEAERRPRRLVPHDWRGTVQLDGVTLTYEGASRPALLGVDLSVAAGEMIAFIGDSGAGKSSLLRVLAGIYPPQAGSVRIDGFDLRQLNPRELRENIAYAPQQPHFFAGTIAQNLRLACPSASDQDLWEAAVDAGVLQDILLLERSFETRIGDASVKQQSPGFLQRLSLARTYLRGGGILLFDEPGRALDLAGDECFRRKLVQLKRSGRQTVLFVTHRPSHLRLADRVIQLKAGRSMPFDPKRIPTSAASELKI